MSNLGLPGCRPSVTNPAMLLRQRPGLLLTLSANTTIDV